MTGWNYCAVCGLRIRQAEGARDRPWLHDDSAYDPFKSPIHAPRPAARERPGSLGGSRVTTRHSAEGQDRSYAAIERASQRLLEALGHECEDALLDAFADTWLGGPDDWFEHGWDDPAAPAHRERVFCLVLEDLARRLIERASSTDQQWWQQHLRNAGAKA